MANAPRQSAPAQKPLPNPAEGFDLFRPFRMAHRFATNTTRDVFNCMAKWANHGLIAGGVIGIAYGFALAATGPISIIGMAMLGGFWGTMGGAAFGAVLGLVTGGPSNASRAQRGEDSRQRMFNADARSEHIDRVNDSNVERILQQNQEYERNDSYWQDRVSQGMGGPGRHY